ncbi:hypothetical protein PR048_033443 [Dryococelus australis]|uniref:Uncharacterized protein n=1 Tax=Dryococelus australis TaxID=614101 RepID=A0ABQ9G0B2_9NEOP|nr:hypothetical protein PR048_033443 [Dryococelus australis]
MREKRGEYGAAPERKDGGGKSPRKPANQRHRPARFPLAKIRELSPVRQGGRRRLIAPTRKACSVSVVVLYCANQICNSGILLHAVKAHRLNYVHMFVLFFCRLRKLHGQALKMRDSERRATRPIASTYVARLTGDGRFRRKLLRICSATAANPLLLNSQMLYVLSTVAVGGQPVSLVPRTLLVNRKGSNVEQPIPSKAITQVNEVARSPVTNAITNCAQVVRNQRETRKEPSIVNGPEVDAPHRSREGCKRGGAYVAVASFRSVPPRPPRLQHVGCDAVVASTIELVQASSHTLKHIFFCVLFCSSLRLAARALSTTPVLRNYHESVSSRITKLYIEKKIKEFESSIIAIPVGLSATWTVVIELCSDVDCSENVKENIRAGKALGDPELLMEENFSSTDKSESSISDLNEKQKYNGVSLSSNQRHAAASLVPLYPPPLLPHSKSESFFRNRLAWKIEEWRCTISSRGSRLRLDTDDIRSHSCTNKHVLQFRKTRLRNWWNHDVGCDLIRSLFFRGTDKEWIGEIWEPMSVKRGAEEGRNARARGNGISPKKPADKRHRQATIPTYENPIMTSPRIEPVLPGLNMSTLTTRPLLIVALVELTGSALPAAISRVRSLVTPVRLFASHKGDPGLIPAGSLRIFACGDRARRCRWSAGFLGIPRFPRPFIPALLHTRLNHPHRLSRPRCKEPPKSLHSPLSKALNGLDTSSVTCRLDSTVLCVLGPQMSVHWLLSQRVASVTSHLPVCERDRSTSQAQTTAPYGLVHNSWSSVGWPLRPANFPGIRNRKLKLVNDLGTLGQRAMTSECHVHQSVLGGVEHPSYNDTPAEDRQQQIGIHMAV